MLLTRGGSTRSAGVLSVNEKGFGLLVFDAGRRGLRYDAVRITLDPAGARPGHGSIVVTWTREA